MVWDKFQSMIKQHGLLAPGQTVVAGVSGGPDSLTLLHLLCRLRDEAGFGLRVIAAHLDHHIRAESAQDAAFVVAQAQEWRVETVVGEADVPAMAQEPGLSLEEAARIARYSFLLQTAKQQGAGVVAVGHNADDQVETVLMHWLRGAGLSGLRGMLPASLLSEMRLGTDAPIGDAVRLIRPLLDCSRDEIEDYCHKNGLRPRVDRTNLDTTIYRNRLRHELVPCLEQYNPNIRAVIQRSASALADDYDYLHARVLKAWQRVVSGPEPGAFEIELSAWRDLHPSLQRGILREAVRRLRWSLRNINWIHIENAMGVLREGGVGQKATLPQGLMVTIGYHRFWIADEAWQPGREDHPQLAEDELAIPVPGQVSFGVGGWCMCAEVTERESLAGAWERNPDPWRAYLDADRLPLDALRLRVRRPGDKFQPLGMGGKWKGVRQLMIGARVPREIRERYPVVWAGDQIAWIPGLRLDERARVRPSTDAVLILTVNPACGAARQEKEG